VVDEAELREVYRQGEDACVAFILEFQAQTAGLVSELEARIAALERRLTMDSSNSSLPPSKDPLAKARRHKEPTGRRPGAQPGHVGVSRARVPARDVAEFRHVYPANCHSCGLSLDERMLVGKPTRSQQLEINIETRLVEYVAHDLCCRVCQRVTPGELSPLQRQAFGSRLQAEVATLVAQGGLTRSKLQHHLRESYGARLSDGAATAIVLRAGESLRPAYAEIRAQLHASAAIHSDETSWRLGGKSCFAWGLCDRQSALYLLGQRRSGDVFEELLADYSGVCHTDRYSVYNRLAARNRQLCWAHLKRDFAALVDSPVEAEQAFAASGLELCARVFQADALEREERLALRAGLHADCLALVEQGRAQREGPAYNLGASLDQHFDSLWHFLSSDDVEATNNRAERTLRPLVIKRKLSYGSGSDSGARALEALLSVVATCRLRQAAPLDFIQRALEAHLLGQPPPALPAAA